MQTTTRSLAVMATLTQTETTPYATYTVRVRDGVIISKRRTLRQAWRFHTDRLLKRLPPASQRIRVAQRAVQRCALPNPLPMHLQRQAD